MKQFKVNKAYNTLSRFAEMRLPLSKAREIYSMIKALDEPYQFAINEERKYIEEFDGVVNNDGTISFESPEKYASFQEKMSDLSDTDVDVKIKPIELTESDLGDQTITPAEIFILEGFISFK